MFTAPSASGTTWTPPVPDVRSVGLVVRMEKGEGGARSFFGGAGWRVTAHWIIGKAACCCALLDVHGEIAYSADTWHPCTRKLTMVSGSVNTPSICPPCLAHSPSCATAVYLFCTLARTHALVCVFCSVGSPEYACFRFGANETYPPPSSRPFLLLHKTRICADLATLERV